MRVCLRRLKYVWNGKHSFLWPLWCLLDEKSISAADFSNTADGDTADCCWRWEWCVQYMHGIRMWMYCMRYVHGWQLAWNQEGCLLPHTPHDYHQSTLTHARNILGDPPAYRPVNECSCRICMFVCISWTVTEFKKRGGRFFFQNRILHLCACVNCVLACFLSFAPTVPSQETYMRKIGYMATLGHSHSRTRQPI